MMRSPGKLLLILAATAFYGGGTPAVQGAVDQAAIARDALVEVIRPGYADLAAAGDVLQGKVETLCRQPSPATLDAAKQTFAATVAAWSKVEILRFGPVTAEHRYERLFFWPDPKGIGLRQVQAALSGKDRSVELPDELAGKSVALQGLPALEYLLYGDGAESLAGEREIVGSQDVPDGVETESAFRCAFALAVATNIDRIAQGVVQDWRDGSAYAKAFLGPVPEDPIYHTPKEVTLDLFKSFTSGIELVRDQKLGKPLGASAAQARPRLAAFWRSGLTFANAADNLDGVRTLFAKGGFAEVVAGESAGVEDSILFDLGHAIEVFRGIDLPMAEVVQDEALRAKIEALRVALKSAAQTGGDMIARGAGLAFGFNAMDGD
jgi:predicted lipoprotein